MRGLAFPAILHDRPFRRFWLGQTVSLFGDQIFLLALPLVAVLVLHASPAEMGYLFAFGLLPSLFFSLQAGVWLDRRGRRRQRMIAADLGRAVLLATIPIAYWLGVLTLVQLYVVAFVIGSLDVVFFVAYSSLFVSLVRRDRYLDAQALLDGSRALSQVGGQSLAGALVAVLSAPVALLADGLSFLVSAFFLSRINPQEPPTSEGKRGSVLGGVRFLRHSPIVGRMLAVSVTVNYFNYIFQALFLLFAVQRLGVGPAILGLILGAGAVGAVFGSILARPVSRRLGLGKAYALGTVLFPAPLLLVPAAPSHVGLTYLMLGLAEFGAGVGVMLFDITNGAIQAAVIPHELRARVAGAYRTANYGIRPLGALSGGLLGAAIGIRPTLWIGAAGGLLCVLWLVRSRVLTMTTPEVRVAAEDTASTTPGLI